MLPKPIDGQPYRVVSFDPGTDTLGAALLEIDLATRKVSIAQVHTFRGAQLQRQYPVITEVHGDRTARLMAHEDNLHGFMQTVVPHSVVTEGPYMGRFPAAFAALTECVSAIRRAVMRFDPFMPLHVIDPSTVKKSMGVKGTSGDKTAMAKALLKATQEPNSILLPPQDIDIAALDEHSVDSICVGYLHARIILDHLGVLV